MSESTRPSHDGDEEEEGSPPSRHQIPRDQPGASPGTLRIESDVRPEIHLVDYSETHLVEKRLATIEEARPFLDDPKSITWLDIRGIGHTPTFERIGELLSIHPLALEDVVNVPQRPKSDVFPKQQVIVTRMVSLDAHAVESEQMSIVFGPGFVLSVQEEPRIDCLDPLRRRLRSGRGKLRISGSDYLAYALLDAVIDGFFPVLEHMGERLDELELRMLEGGTTTPSEVFEIKRELLQLRRAIWPQRDLLSNLLREESPFLAAETRLYLRDTYDHVVQIMDMVESFRELASSLMDLLMTTASQRLNEVMKVLTVLSTVFLPMTFVAGVYGMNFDTSKSPLAMPELGWSWGYPFSLALMALSALSLLFYYRSQGWIGKEGDRYERAFAKLRGVKRRARKLGRPRGKA